MSRWWRAEDTSIDHPKLLKLSDAMFRAWYTLNCVASANDGVLPPTGDIAIRLRMKPAKVAEWITKLVAAGLYDNDNGIFRPHNWTKRQYKTDGTDPTNAERQKRYRERHRNGSNGVTDNGSNDVTVKRPEAEAKSETEQSRADAGAPVDEDLKRKASALGAAISAHFISRGQPIPNLDRCLLWLTQGYAQGTILGAVERVLKRSKPVSTLDYFDGAIRDDHAKAAPENLQVVISKKVFVEQGTLAWQCWQSESRRLGGRGYPCVTHRVDHVAKEGFWFESEFPAGYDEQTGERLSQAAEACVA